MAAQVFTILMSLCSLDIHMFIYSPGSARHYDSIASRRQRGSFSCSVSSPRSVALLSGLKSPSIETYQAANSLGDVVCSLPLAAFWLSLAGTLLAHYLVFARKFDRFAAEETTRTWGSAELRRQPCLWLDDLRLTGRNNCS
jgi:hypothetical protein